VGLFATFIGLECSVFSRKRQPSWFDLIAEPYFFSNDKDLFVETQQAKFHAAWRVI
jgi:hypothetical protein